MPDLLDRLKVALADRYAIERELAVLTSTSLVEAGSGQAQADLTAAFLRSAIGACEGLLAGDVTQ